MWHADAAPRSRGTATACSRSRPTPGQQTRLLGFDAARPAGSAQPAGILGRGLGADGRRSGACAAARAPPAAAGGRHARRSSTTNLTEGWLRRNGAPYSEQRDASPSIWDRVRFPTATTSWWSDHHRQRPALPAERVHPQRALQARAGRVEMASRPVPSSREDARTCLDTHAIAVPARRRARARVPRPPFSRRAPRRLRRRAWWTCRLVGDVQRRGTAHPHRPGPGARELHRLSAERRRAAEGAGLELHHPGGARAPGAAASGAVLDARARARTSTWAR